MVFLWRKLSLSWSLLWRSRLSKFKIWNIPASLLFYLILKYYNTRIQIILNIVHTCLTIYSFLLKWYIYYRYIWRSEIIDSIRSYYWYYLERVNKILQSLIDRKYKINWSKYSCKRRWRSHYCLNIKRKRWKTHSTWI